MRVRAFIGATFGMATAKWIVYFFHHLEFLSSLALMHSVLLSNLCDHRGAVHSTDRRGYADRGYDRSGGYGQSRGGGGGGSRDGRR